MHPILPTGDVTFFMTDVEGSTRAWELRPNLMREALRFHDELAESICQKHGGFLLKSKGEGDALFIVFQEPDQALRAAVELQSGQAMKRSMSEWHYTAAPSPTRVTGIILVRWLTAAPGSRA
jgi:class 3 adenylate cyclase